jgi:hypothetical protein
MKEYVISRGTAFGWHVSGGEVTQDISRATKYKTLDVAWKKAVELSAPAVYEIEAFATKVIENGVWKENAMPSNFQMKHNVKKALQTIYEHGQEVNGIMIPVFQEEVAIIERALTDTTLEIVKRVKNDLDSLYPYKSILRAEIKKALDEIIIDAEGGK